MKQVVRVTCSSTDLIDPKKLTPFQGELKWLEDKQYEKLKTSLLNHGFVFPVFGWKHARKNYVIDAHQRLLALTKMQSEGIALEGNKVPIVWVEADNEVDARKLILLAVSQYGRYDYDSMYKFMSESGISFADVKSEMDFPTFNMGTFEAGWFDDSRVDVAGEKLSERFGAPPFSVLDARQGYWQERKRQWLELGIRSEIGRGGPPGGSPRPAADYSDGARGDGHGRRI